MKLSILIPHSDRKQVALDSLKRAVEYINLNWEDIPYRDCLSKHSYDDFEIIGYHSNETSGKKRNILTKEAKGEYICFVDDDDAVKEEYLLLLLHSLHADVVSFNLEFINEGKHTETWKFLTTPNVRNSGIMCVNHLCAWRKTLATKIAWCNELGYSDDRLWYEPLYASGLITTTLHINRILYSYIFSKSTSLNQNSYHIRLGKEYIGKGIRCFKHQDDIVIEVPSKHPHNHVLVRDSNNRELCIPVRELKLFHTVK